jgi:hypothetical protein
LIVLAPLLGDRGIGAALSSTGRLIGAVGGGSGRCRGAYCDSPNFCDLPNLLRSRISNAIRQPERIGHIAPFAVICDQRRAYGMLVFEFRKLRQFQRSEMVFSIQLIN